jgi:hypothetical protein
MQKTNDLLGALRWNLPMVPDLSRTMGAAKSGQNRAATQGHKAHKFHRQHLRVLFSVPITVRHLSRGGGMRTTQGISLDLGEGGLGAIVRGDVQVGETVAIDFQLSEQLLKAVAIVRHTSGVHSGFEFVGLTPEERSQIASVIGNT